MFKFAQRAWFRANAWLKHKIISAKIRFFLYLSLLFFCCCFDVWNIWAHALYIQQHTPFCSGIDFIFPFKKEEPKVQLCFDLIMWFSHVSYPVIPADVRYVRKEKIVIQVNWLMTITPLHIWYDVCVCVCTRLNNQKIHDNSVSEWAGCMFWYLI